MRQSLQRLIPYLPSGKNPMQFLFGLLGGALAVLAMAQTRPANPKIRRKLAPTQTRHPSATPVTRSRWSAYYRINLN